MDELKWTQLGALAPLDLGTARAELHWAAQILAAVADALLPRAEDDSHTNLFWSAAEGALLGRALTEGRRLGLRFADLTLIVVQGGSIVASLSLVGKRLEEGLSWAAQVLGAAEGVSLRSYAMPECAVGRGEAFGEIRPAYVELGRYYASATEVLGELAGREAGATAIAVWPHHFDLGGILFPPSEGGDRERAPQIGFGLSPGDGSIPEPYFYITPWPLPEDPQLGPLEGGGVWHRQGFTGALLRASDLVASGGLAEEQLAQVRLYLRSALVASRALLATHGSELSGAEQS